MKGWVFPDPGIHFGHFRVLPYTPGGYVVIDDRRPIGKQMVARVRSLDDASDRAATLDIQDGERRD